jgi:hypothetical protein
MCEGRLTRPEEIQFNGKPELINKGYWHRPTDRKMLGKSCENYYLKEFPVGTKVIVFDSTLYKNDKITPLSMTMLPATVVRWYDITSPLPNGGTITENVIDVIFDHRPEEVSHGHFTTYLSGVQE